MVEIHNMKLVCDASALCGNLCGLLQVARISDMFAVGIFRRSTFVLNVEVVLWELTIWL